jgi:hypothetical protein
LSIEIKVINDGFSSIYYDASGCGPTTSYNIEEIVDPELHVVREIRMGNPCLPCPTLLRIEEIKPGETKTIDIWNQKYYNEPDACDCDIDPTCGERYVHLGNYTISFTLNVQNRPYPLPKETSKTISKTVEIIENLNCTEKCKSLDFASGICRSWPVTPEAEWGCKENETNVGKTPDCYVPKRFVGVGKTCCCY